MKKLMYHIVFVSALLTLCGCVGTVAPTPWGRCYRLAIAYPFAVESCRMVTTNGTFEIAKYVSEGANSNTVALVGSVSEGVAEGVAAAVLKSKSASVPENGTTPRDLPCADALLGHTVRVQSLNGSEGPYDVLIVPVAGKRDDDEAAQ